MSLLILIRHGETGVNIIGKIHKHKDTEKLTKNGISQMEKTSDALRVYGPTSVYCSKTVRAKQSAKIIADRLKIPLFEMEGLEERNFGDYSGLSYQEMKEKAGLESMSFSQRYTFYPPNGESWKEAEHRLLKSLYKILEANKDENLVVVTHGGSIRIYMPTLLGVGKEESYKYDPDNASITVFDYTDSKFKQIIYNDTTHIRNK
jgi:broad specificity phosphatase PhoE